VSGSASDETGAPGAATQVAASGPPRRPAKTGSVVNRRLKRWPGWVLLAFVVAGFLAVGAFRSSGPTTQGDRVDAIASRVACPICAGESVFVSQNSASRAIRSEITELVNDNDLSDADIIAFIETRYGAQVLLVPRSTGFDALIWVLPAVGLICGLAGLTVVFRRWKREAAATADPTDADRELVASALADDARAAGARADGPSTGEGRDT
jgi:cytochrome c-type biogenesis protein CcmH